MGNRTKERIKLLESRILMELGDNQLTASSVYSGVIHYLPDVEWLEFAKRFDHLVNCNQIHVCGADVGGKIYKRASND